MAMRWAHHLSDTRGEPARALEHAGDQLQLIGLRRRQAAVLHRPRPEFLDGEPAALDQLLETGFLEAFALRAASFGFSSNFSTGTPRH